LWRVSNTGSITYLPPTPCAGIPNNAGITPPEGQRNASNYCTVFNDIVNEFGEYAGRLVQLDENNNVVSEVAHAGGSALPNGDGARPLSINDDGYIAASPGVLWSPQHDYADIRQAINDGCDASDFRYTRPQDETTIQADARINNENWISYSNLILRPACPEIAVTTTGTGFTFVDGKATVGLDDQFTITTRVSNTGVLPIEQLSVADDASTEDFFLRLFGPDPPFPTTLAPGESFSSTTTYRAIAAGDFAGSIKVTGTGECGPITKLHPGEIRIRGFELVVTTTGDESDATADDVCDVDESEDGNQCTLRAAMEIANLSAGRDSISFAIEGTGLQTITLGSALPVITEPVVIDARTQGANPVTPLVALTGSGIDHAFVSNAGKTTIRGFVLGGFRDAAIKFTGEGENRVESSHIGVDALGTAAKPNAVGILIDGSPRNTIGGPTPQQRNVISGNADARPDADPDVNPTSAGILIKGTAAAHNEVVGNYVGTNVSGTAAIPNAAAGVWIDDAPDNTVGGNVAAAGNLISGNADYDVLIAGPEADRNIVIGNTIGTNADGTLSLSPDAVGVLIQFGDNNKIGLSTSSPGVAPGNLISGHPKGVGVGIVGINPAILDDLEIEFSGQVDFARENSVAGNLIGLNRAGTDSVANSIGVLAYLSAPKTTIGGSAATARNVISGNRTFGVALWDSLGYGAPDESVVAANYIGTTADGTQALRNKLAGMLVGSILLSDQNGGVKNAIIGGETPSSGNVIAGNDTTQIWLNGGGTDNIRILNNRIGLLTNGEAGQTRETSKHGILAEASGIIVGESGHGNFIGGNRSGVTVVGGTTLLNDNFIGTSPNGASTVPNDVGIWVLGDEVVIGDETGGNLISGNNRYGILIGETDEFDAPGSQTPAPNDVTITRNTIGTNFARTTSLGNGLVATSAEPGAGIGIAGGDGPLIVANTISGNRHGIWINNGSGGTTTLGYNVIGIGAAGEAGPRPIPNTADGIHVADGIVTTTTDYEIDAPTDIAGVGGNAIWFNLGAGLRAPETGSKFRMAGSSLFANGGLAIDLGSPGQGAGGAYSEAPDFFIPRIEGDEMLLLGRPSVSGVVTIYRSPLCDAAGYGEGAYVFASGAGVAGQRFEIPMLLDPEHVGEFVTAISTTSDSETEFSICRRIPEQDRSEIYDVIDDNVSSSIDPSLQIDISVSTAGKRSDVSANGSAALQGYLYLAVHDRAPVLNSFDGTATGNDGGLVTPDAVSSRRYWEIATDSLESFVYSACLDLSDVGGVTDSQQLVVLSRERTGLPWTPVNSTINGNGWLCADGLEAGEVAIGANSSVNPVGVENEYGPGDDSNNTNTPTIADDDRPVFVFPNPARGQATVVVRLDAADDVDIALFDVLGRRTRRLHAGTLPTGEHRFSIDTGEMADGLYFIVIRKETSAVKDHVAMAKLVVANE
ncbi:MAG: T9SS type A sorting domain-containing protein, partial [Bacteroidetes bacterium]|nr:T9SS type A sorting domain-containing protein [Bacteroidota bacterium]